MKKLFILLLFTVLKLSAQDVNIVFFDNPSQILKNEICSEVQNVYHKNNFTIRYDLLPTSVKFNNRYRADKLLIYLASRYGKNTIGVTAKDISTTKGQYADWGVFGLGSAYYQTAVISSYRLKTVQDLVSTFLHELGHIYGLPHCPTKNCLMEDAKGKYTPASYYLCGSCQNKLK